MNEKYKRKAVIGTIVATGIAATACGGGGTSADYKSEASTKSQSESVSAAERIVIDGQELDTGKILTDTARLRQVKPLYGPPRPPKLKREEATRDIETVYGPPSVFDE